MDARVMSKALDLVPSPAPAPLAQLEHLVERAKSYAGEARAKNTHRAYASDFEAFEAWCQANGLEAMPSPPAAVAAYAAALADLGRRPSTITRALTGIAYAHRSHGHEWVRAHPAITMVMAGIRRRLGVAQKKKAPIMVDRELEALVATLDDGPRGRRDRALLLVGFFGAFRRSELVAVTVEDVERQREGLIIRVRRSKSDQEGRGRDKGIPYASRASVCPVRALDAWLEASGIKAGPIFRAIDRHGHMKDRALSDQTVADVVQRVALAAGLDPENLAAHSLRSGFVTSAARRGKSLDAIMRQTFHATERVARGYIQHATVFDDNAATGIA